MVFTHIHEFKTSIHGFSMPGRIPQMLLRSRAKLFFDPDEICYYQVIENVNESRIT